MQNVTFDELTPTSSSHELIEDINIKRLIFTDCKNVNKNHGSNKIFEVIANAGDFPPLEFFSVQNMILDSIYFCPFLPTSISFQNTIFLDLKREFFLRHRICLKRLSIEFIPEYLNIDLLLNDEPAWQWNIEALSLRTHQNQMRTIARSNFTSLNRLAFLDLSKCKIDNILSGAFDHILNTLKTLVLHSNFIEMPVYILHQLIDKMNTSLGLHVHLMENEIECNCEVMELCDIVQFNRFETPNLVVEMPCRTIENRSHCEPLQVIDGTSRCFPSSTIHAYSKFSIKMNDNEEQIMITAPGVNKYRVFVQSFNDEGVFHSKWGYAPNRCPRAGFIKRYVKCLSLHHTNETIPLSYFGQIGNMVRIICINYVTAGSKRFWPLHCVPHQINVEDQLQQFVTVKMYLLFLATGASILFLGGCILPFL